MKNGARTLLLLFGDVVALALAFLVMMHMAFFGTLTQELIVLHILPFSVLSIIWVVIFFVFNLYDPQYTKPNIPHLQHIFTAFIVATVVGVIFFYTIPFFKITPKTNLLIFGIIALILFNVWRRTFYNIFASHFRKDAVFIVEGENNKPQVEKLKNYIASYPQSGFIISGIYNSLEQFFKEYKGGAPQVFIVSKEIWRDQKSFQKLFETKSEILDLAYAYEDILGRIPIEAIDEGWFMHNVRSHEKKIFDFGKECVGIIIAILVLALLSPLLLIIALFIKLSDGGPILYSQTRIGKDDREFRLYKFRSMIINAEQNGPEWSTKKDPRVTPVGKIIRKLHVDELPQMFNVIRRDIALVGPRPERPEFVEKLEGEIPFYHLRHIITPGFTGWAQIKFRYAGNIMDSKEKFEYDLYYLKNRNSFMDLGILLRTIQIIFTH